MNEALKESDLEIEASVEDTAVSRTEDTAVQSAENVPAPLTEDSEGGAEPSAETDSDSETSDDTDYAALAAEDIAKIRELFPECRSLRSVTELENPLRYATLRDLGLSVKEAFLATQKRSARYDNRAHLKSSVPRGAVSDGASMSAEALREARELFSGLSDTEIQKLYKSVIK